MIEYVRCSNVQCYCFVFFVDINFNFLIHHDAYDYYWAVYVYGYPFELRMDLCFLN